MMALEKEQASALWEALLTGKAPKVQPKPSAEVHWLKNPDHYYNPGEWQKVECQLVVSRTRCSCGAVYEAPNRLMNLWYRERTSEKKWLPLKPEESVGTVPRSIRTIEHDVTCCQQCFERKMTLS